MHHFSIQSPSFSSNLVQRFISFFCPQNNKILLVEWQATHALLPSRLDQWKNGGLSKRLWVDQTGHSQEQEGRDYAVDASTPASPGVWSFNGVGGNVQTGTVVQHCDAFDSIPRRSFKNLVSAGPEVVHCIGYYLVLCSFHVSVPELSLMHPASVWVSNFFLIGDVGCFHTLAFSFCSVMVDSRIVSSDRECKKSAILFKITVEWTF